MIYIHVRVSGQGDIIQVDPLGVLGGDWGVGGSAGPIALYAMRHALSSECGGRLYIGVVACGWGR